MGDRKAGYFQRVEFKPAASALSGSLLEIQILSPILNVLNQKVWGWGPAICVLTSPADDSDSGYSLRITAPVLKLNNKADHLPRYKQQQRQQIHVHMEGCLQASSLQSK